MIASTPPVHQPSAGMEFPRWSETLQDNSYVLIRPIAAQDKDAERTFIAGLSAQSRRYRFLGAMACPSERMIEQFINIDYVHEVAFAAVIPEDARERIVGISRYSTDAEGVNCECAVTVSDEWQQKGLGTLLMKHLIEVARTRGIRRMTSIDLAENTRMQDLARYLGFSTRADPDDATQVIHELDLQDMPS
jgi:GNAT superfamily N-acetyltransferase